MARKVRKGKKKVVREIVVRKSDYNEAAQRRHEETCGKPAPLKNSADGDVRSYQYSGGKSPIYFLLETIAKASHDLKEGSLPHEVVFKLDAAFYQVQNFRNYHEFSATALRFEDGGKAVDAYLKEHAPESTWGRFKRFLFVPVLRRFAAWLYDDVMQTTPMAYTPMAKGWGVAK